MKFIDVSTVPRRIVGIAADVDDENVVPEPAMTVYHPLEQEFGGGRLFVHARSDPYALVPPITRIIRELSAEQPVEQAGDARGRARRGPRARPAERARLRRVRGGGADHRRGRRRRRAGVLGERADARVRHPPRRRIGAAAIS